VSEYTMEELTGLTIHEYAKAMGKTIDDMIDEKKREISIYARRYDELVERRERMDIAILAKEVKAIEHGKREKLAKFIKWSEDGKS